MNKFLVLKCIGIYFVLRLIYTAYTWNGFSYNWLGPEVFVDQYFEPILDTFRHPDRYRMRTNFKNGSEPTLLIVSSFALSSVYMQESYYHINHGECPLPCKIVEGRAKMKIADAVVFNIREINKVRDTLDSMAKDRNLSQPWILHTTECPATALKRLGGVTYKSLNGTFNRTSYFRRDADVLWTHGFVVSRQDANLLPQSWHLEAPPISPKPFAKRNVAAAFISNCRSRSGRLEYINELSEHFEVHVYGRCGRYKCGGSRLVRTKFRINQDECLKSVAENYLFYLSFENNIAVDYVTEKVYNILYYPVVPVVFGGAEYDKLLPPNSYVDAQSFTPKQLGEHLTALASDEERYNLKLAWRKDYIASTLANHRVYCQLCTKLYDPDFYTEKVYDDTLEWFVNRTHSNRRYRKGRNVTTFEENIV